MYPLLLHSLPILLLPLLLASPSNSAPVATTDLTSPSLAVAADNDANASDPSSFPSTLRRRAAAPEAEHGTVVSVAMPEIAKHEEKDDGETNVVLQRVRKRWGNGGWGGGNRGCCGGSW